MKNKQQINNDYDIRAEFYIFGTKLSPDELTKILGIKPSKQWLQGESVCNTLLKRKCNAWGLFPSIISDDLNEQILSILNLLIPKAEIIKSICERYELECEFSCVIYIVNNDYPPLFLDAETINLMSQIGASIDIDLI